jgi:hypothetical protein
MQVWWGFITSTNFFVVLELGEQEREGQMDHYALRAGMQLCSVDVKGCVLSAFFNDVRERVC